MSGDAPAHRYLQIYLSDHRAGGAAGLARARAAAASNRGTPLGAALESIAQEIEEDASSLDKASDVLGIAPAGWKQSLARAGERLGRLKLNGQLLGYSPLSRVVDLEALLAGIDAKHSLWRALQASPAAGTLASMGLDVEALGRRAQDQRARLAPHHQEAAREAFAERSHRFDLVTGGGEDAGDDRAGNQRGLS